MKIVIIEDEPLAADRLQELIHEYESHIEVLARLDSVESAVAWFNQHGMPELIFMDIQLADGISFQIFEQSQIKVPVIFTTAYDEYAIKAFKVNSIDYLLKPLSFDAVADALDKYVQLHVKQDAPPTIDPALVQSLMSQLHKPSFKSRFIVKKGEHLLSVGIEQINYFYAEDKVSFLKTREGKRYIIQQILGELEELLDPDIFFRINRQYIARFEAITDIISYSNSRLKVNLSHCEDDGIIVSKQKVQAFKQWLDQ
ncbi:MAG: LytTR family DNA-binding domain-containing protein [Bacteroidota bacterium]